jgi:hypothetical protein
VIHPQFPIEFGEGVTVDIGSQLARQGRFGFQDPVIQWVQGRERSFSFRTTVFSEFANVTETQSASVDANGIDFEFTELRPALRQMGRAEKERVTRLLDQFERIAVKDETLGRLPILIFSYGDRISQTVLCEAAPQQFKSLHPDGSPQEIEIQITLVKYEPFSQRRIDPTKPVKESFLLVATDAERSYEAIARRYYGDPLLGDRLRKRHPESPLAPTVGAVVRVPARGVMLGETVEPEAHMLSLTDQDAVENFERILAARSARKLVVTS